MNIENLRYVSDYVVGWPLMIYVILVSLGYTIALRGIQFRCFFVALRELFSPSQSEGEKNVVTPFQAFLTTLNANLGNGSIAGIATAVYAGGPGAALWIVIFGFILMAIRFTEVYVSTHYGMRAKVGSVLGGPMLYLKDAPGGKYLSYIYAVLCLIYTMVIGSSVQSNSIGLSLLTTWNVPVTITATILFFFMLYALLGGADRIMKLSASIIPIKVIVFVVSATVVLIYHYKALPSALWLIVMSGFGYQAFVGGILGFTVQHAIRQGMLGSVMATESGLGTAAILFGFTGSRDPMRSGFMGMMSTFISAIVCFVVALCIVVSGVWNTGANSTALTIASFNTVFGTCGGWIVSFLSISFGLGVLIASAYVARASWLFLTNNKFISLFIASCSICTFCGALVDADVVWSFGSIILAIMLAINLFGLLCLLPQIRANVLHDLRERGL